MQLRVTLLIAVIVLASCSAEQRYRGDGHLVDHGPGAANDRYVLDLGALDLATAKTIQWRMRDLPETEFVAGVQIAPAEQAAALPEGFSAR